MHSHRLPQLCAVPEAARNRTREYTVQLQRAIPRRCLCPRFRFVSPATVAAGNRSLSKVAAISGDVRDSEQNIVENPGNAQPLQLRPYGDVAESGTILRGLPVQDPEA